MKKSPLFLLFILVNIVPLGAQNTGALIKSFTEKLNSHQSIEMHFRLVFAHPVKGALQNFDGTLLCSGNKYRLLTDDVDIYSDGRNKWMCNKTANEAIAQYVSDDENTVDMTDHPLRFITAYQKDFSYKKKELTTEQGKTRVTIEFTPKDNKAAYTSILLTLDEQTADPHTIVYHVKDGSSYTITITRITPNVEVFDGYFAFPKHKYPGIELIDLR